MNIFYRLAVFVLLATSGMLSSCERFVDIDLPNTMIVDKAVFKDEETAMSAAQGMYYLLYSIGNFASGSPNSVSVVGGLAADELVPHNSVATSDFEFYQNEITLNNSANGAVWKSAYNTIYMANAIMEGVASSTGISDAVRRQLEGEARFVRAFTFFYLVNLYGDVPLVLTTDYRVNALLSRAPKADVYTQIIADLETSRALLSKTYPEADRTRPNYYATTALLARMRLYMEQWEAAGTTATEVIDATDTYTLLEDLDDVFLAESREAVWQVKPDVGGNTREGNLFILEATAPRVSLNKQLAEIFLANDHRRQHWINMFEDEQDNGYLFAFKYKVRNSTEAPTEYSIALRYAELFLIRAEARAKQDRLAEAVADLDVIRERAGIPLIADVQPGISKTTLLDTILQERRKEFFTEWGHRWLDLKRTRMSDAVLGAIKPTWRATDVLFPIPESERLKNPNLGQNNGY